MIGERTYGQGARSAACTPAAPPETSQEPHGMWNRRGTDAKPICNRTTTEQEPTPALPAGEPHARSAPTLAKGSTVVHVAVQPTGRATFQPAGDGFQTLGWFGRRWWARACDE